MAQPVPQPRPAPQGARPASGPTQTARPAAPVPAKKSLLSSVVSGPRRDPKLWWFYGDEGIGKSSLVADAPSPIFLDIEGRTRHLHVKRYNFRPQEGDEGTVPRTLTEVEEAIDDLVANGKAAGFETVVFDGLAALEALIFDRIVSDARARGHRNKEGKEIENIEDFGFSTGQKVAAQMWRVLVNRFNELRFRAGMHVVLLGHALVAKYKNPTADDYDTYRPRLDEKAAGVLLEKCDVVGFVTYEDQVRKSGRKAIGVSGDRVIHLQRTTTWAAKNSLPMPKVIDLVSEAPWQPFDEALEALYSMSPEGLREMIERELGRLGASWTNTDGRQVTADMVRHAIKRAGDDTGVLHRHLVGLQQSATTDTKTEESAS
jgi:AAA domain-containing protein